MADAGWYPDPTGDHELRWFDGAAWTEHVHATAPQPAASDESTVVADVTVAKPATAEIASAGTSATAVAVPASAPPVDIPTAVVPSTREVLPDEPDYTAGTPEPSPGWGLLLVFAALLVAAFVLPFGSAGGSAEPLSTDLEAIAPVLVLAGGAVAAALAGRSGYDIGPAMGGGVVVVFSVVVALIAPIIKAFIDFGSFEPNIGVVCFAAAAVVGLLIAIPSFRLALRSADGPPVPPLLGWAGAAGTALYVWGATRPAYDGAALLTGDLWVDSALVTLLVVVVAPALIMATVRSAASAALLGGVLVFPAASWFTGAISDGGSFGVSRPAGFEQMGYGLLIALTAAAIGIFGFAQRTVRTASGVQHVPARSTGPAVVIIGVILVAGLVALDKGSSNGSSDFGDARDGFTGDGAPPECIDAWIYDYPAPGYCDAYR